MAGGGRVVCDKDALLRQTLDALLRGILGLTPCEIIDVFLQKLPVLPQILSDIELLVYLARLIAELLTVGPGCGEGPIFLNGMELEFVYLFT